MHIQTVTVVKNKVVARSEVVFSYTINCKIAIVPGRITAKFGSLKLLDSGTYPNTVGVLPAGTAFTRQFHTHICYHRFLWYVFLS